MKPDISREETSQSTDGSDDCPCAGSTRIAVHSESLERLIAEHPAEFFAGERFDPVGACAVREAVFASVELPETPTSPQAHADHLLNDVLSARDARGIAHFRRTHDVVAAVVHALARQGGGSAEPERREARERRAR
ncbi:hypothetical protein ACU4GD_37590 [Cupriavidus basilensis]